MSEAAMSALKSIAASSAAEGLPMSADQLQLVMEILDGKKTLGDYFEMLKKERG